jgi:hypothetical protein
MKKLDRIIYYGLMTVLTIIGLYSAWNYPVGTLRFIAGMLAIAYGVFLFAHICFFVPLIGIICMFEDSINEIGLFNRLRDKSSILWWLLYIFVLLHILFVVYIYVYL